MRLHIHRGNVGRTVTFLVRDGRPEWVGEHEIHYGPRTWDSVDGTGREFIALSCSLEDLPDAPKGCDATLWGPKSAEDPHLISRSLSVGELKWIWSLWDRGGAPAKAPPDPTMQPPSQDRRG